MNSLEQRKEIDPRIETIREIDQNGRENKASISPERGVNLLELIMEDKKILYLDEGTFKNRETNIKGGIPILFPNAGPIPDELKDGIYGSLKQHGFARDLEWSVVKTENGFKSILISNEETMKVYPFEFKLELEHRFEENGSFMIIQSVTNLEKEKDINISSGLHPYFNVKSSEKKNIKFNFEGGKIIEEKFETWANGKAISIENHGFPLEVEIPGLGTLIFTLSSDFQRIWVWSQEGKDFVCVEPVMRDKGGIIIDPEKIKPGETHISSFNIAMKK